MITKYKKGLVVLSGGQDSVTCLGVALKQCESVIAIGFNYGQRHSVEIKQASHIVSMIPGVTYNVVELGGMLSGLVTSSLTGPGEVTDEHPDKPGLPASFVPGRNALFLTLSHAYAQSEKCDAIYTGVCETDYSGYPDCRQSFINHLGNALNVGYESDITIVTPLMYKNKAETFRMAREYYILDTVIEHSHTCYEGDRSKRFDWGYGCGECPACLLRAKGWDDLVKQDNLEQAALGL